MTFPGVADTSGRIIFLQGLLQGTTTLTVSAPGYATNVQTITVDPSGFGFLSPIVINTNMFAADTTLSFSSVRLTPGAIVAQAVRAGLTVDVNVTSSDTNVGVITVSPLTFGANIVTQSTAFNPLAAGTTTITVETPAGFDTAPGSQITATVTAPAIFVPPNRALERTFRRGSISR